MTTLAFIAIGSLLFLAGHVCGARFGRERGWTDGRNAEWVAQYFARVRTDRARRNRFGQFKEKVR